MKVKQIYLGKNNTGLVFESGRNGWEAPLSAIGEFITKIEYPGIPDPYDPDERYSEPVYTILD